MMQSFRVQAINALDWAFARVVAILSHTMFRIILIVRLQPSLTHLRPVKRPSVSLSGGPWTACNYGM